MAQIVGSLNKVQHYLIYQSIMNCEIPWGQEKKFYEIFESFEALAGYGNGFREEIVFNCSLEMCLVSEFQ